MSGHSAIIDGTPINIGSGLGVAKFVAAVLAILAITGCANQVDQTTLASGVIPVVKISASMSWIAVPSITNPLGVPITRARCSTIAAILARYRTIMAA